MIGCRASPCSSGIVVLASHDHVLLRDTCNWGFYLEGGRVRAFGAA